MTPPEGAGTLIGSSVGADDHVTKPFSVREHAAAVDADLHNLPAHLDAGQAWQAEIKDHHIGSRLANQLDSLGPVCATRV